MSWHLNLMEINYHISNGIKFIHSIPVRMGWPFHSDRNGMHPFGMEVLIADGMEWPFHSGQNGIHSGLILLALVLNLSKLRPGR